MKTETLHFGHCLTAWEVGEPILCVGWTVLESPTPSSRQLVFVPHHVCFHPYFSFYSSMIQISEFSYLSKSANCISLRLLHVKGCQLLLEVFITPDKLNNLSFKSVFRFFICLKTLLKPIFYTIRIIYYIKLKCISILCKLILITCVYFGH